MNVNVCYDRYGKKSSIETGSTNKNLRTSLTTKNVDNNGPKAISDILRSSPIKGPSVRSKSDLSLGLNHNNKGTNNAKMAVNGTISRNGTMTLPRSSSSNPLVPTKPKTTVRSKSDLWKPRNLGSCKPTMATVTETVIVNGTKSRNTRAPPRRMNSNPCDENIKQSVRIPKSNDIKQSKIPRSPSFHRKLIASTTNSPPQELKSELQFTSQNKACEKPINRTQSSYMIQSKSGQKQRSAYGQNKERS